MEGAKKEGVVGLIKGFGKGIGGVVLKPNAGKSRLDALPRMELLTLEPFGVYPVTHSKVFTRSCKSILDQASRITLSLPEHRRVTKTGIILAKRSV